MAEAESARDKAAELLGSPKDAPAAEGSADDAGISGDDSMEGLDIGKAAEDSATKELCYWDQEINAELQVELLLCLQRLGDNFAAAAMSIQHSRPFDAVCMVVPGLMACLADSVLRRLATDRPSKFTGVLLGLNAADGRRLGFPGFGLSVGSFADQTQTMEVHCPELLLSRTAVVDYFTSPDQVRRSPPPTGSVRSIILIRIIIEIMRPQRPNSGRLFQFSSKIFSGAWTRSSTGRKTSCSSRRGR
jgi:hypothetical protein